MEDGERRLHADLGVRMEAEEGADELRRMGAAVDDNVQGRTV